MLLRCRTRGARTSHIDRLFAQPAAGNGATTGTRGVCPRSCTCATLQMPPHSLQTGAEHAQEKARAHTLQHHPAATPCSTTMLAQAPASERLMPRSITRGTQPAIAIYAAHCQPWPLYSTQPALATHTAQSQATGMYAAQSQPWPLCSTQPALASMQHTASLGHPYGTKPGFLKHQASAHPSRIRYSCSSQVESLFSRKHRPVGARTAAADSPSELVRQHGPMQASKQASKQAGDKQLPPHLLIFPDTFRARLRTVLSSRRPMSCGFSLAICSTFSCSSAGSTGRAQLSMHSNPCMQRQSSCS